jgi:K+-transporting ATPase KdpC subunit
MIRTQLRPTLVSFALLTVIVGLIYPLVVTGVAQVVFPYQANGSVMTSNGQATGSALIGQPFDDPKYFWGRLSATGPFPYNSASSSGSNYGPMNPDYLKAVQARIDALKAADPGNTAPIPVDLVTASGSGLDPQISVAAALYQVPRVARMRHLSEGAVQQLVAQYTEDRQLGVLGEPRVDVLQLNLALDAQK